MIGLGLGRHHVAAYTQEKAVARLVACDSDEDRLEEIRAEFPQIAATYRYVEEMLAQEHLDVVSIVTPDHLHRPHAARCLQARCHVLLTKPIATNLADARAIVGAAEAANRKLMVAHERRFRSRFIRIKELLSSGDLGEIVHLRIDAIQDKRGQFRRSPWYASAEAGRTALVGSGIHEVDLLRHLIARSIRSVFAFSNRLGSLQFPADKTTAALYRFEGDAIGQVTVTYEAHQPSGPDAGFCLIATQGMVVGNRAILDSRGTWEDLPQDKSEIVTGTFGCVHSFLRSVLDDTPVPITGRDAFASLAACVAADESAATGMPTLPAPPDSWAVL